MDYLNGHEMTLANSIIGVSVLAMPYCFKQCGIVLSVFMLLFSSIISRLACHFLLKSAIIARRKTFEFLAFHTFGALGKFAIEIGIIGFLLGTCIAFFVVMGDLGPEIVSEITGARTSSTLRSSLLMALALFCVLPLGLLRNVDSLHSVSKATVCFYFCLVLKIIIEALPHIFSGDFYENIIFWRSEGILQCLPIFCMALFCQTQLFEIYQALQIPTLEKMNSLVRIAVNICTMVYILVGVFGYIAFSKKQFTGNILLSFTPTIMSDIIKLGFVLSIAFSFPLVIFPCRASLYSLLYKPTYSLHEGSSNYIPEGKFKGLTLLIVFVSLIIGIMIPNIELILGLVGSTIGVMICVLFPVTCFICISPKNNNEKLLAQTMLFVGIIVMVLGTYKNLNNSDFGPIKVNIKSPEVIKAVSLEKLAEIPKKIEEKESSVEKVELKVEVKEVRHEPPQPEEPPESVKVPKEEKKEEKPVLDKKEERGLKKEEAENLNPITIDQKPKPKVEEEDIEVVKEDVELKEQEKEKKDKEVEDPAKQLLEDMKKQSQVQRELAEQQKQLLEVIKKHEEKVNHEEIDKVNEEKAKAVKEIESIALQAIEKIRGQDSKNPSTEKSIPKEQVTKKDLKYKKPLPYINSEKKVNNMSNKTNLTENKMIIAPLPLAFGKNVSILNQLKGSQNNTSETKPEILKVENVNLTIKEVKVKVELKKDQNKNQEENDKKKEEKEEKKEAEKENEEIRSDIL